MSEIDEILKRIPLKTRLNVLNHMMLQTFLIDNGFIPEGYWDDEKELKYGKMLKESAERMTNAEIDTFKEWDLSGSPE